MEPVYSEGVEDTSTATPFVPEDGDGLLEALQKDFERLKAQKARATGGVEGRVLMDLAFLHDEQYVKYTSKTLSLEPEEANKLHLTFNLIQPRFNKLVGRLSAFNAPFKARPNHKDPQAIEEAEIVDRMIIALDEKLDEPSRLRERLYWMGVGGVAFEYVPWVPNATVEIAPVFDPQTGELLYEHTLTKEVVPESIALSDPTPEQYQVYEENQMQGEVGSEILGPLNVFVDQSVRSIQDLAPDQWVHIAKVRTVGWVKENFGVDVKPQKEISLIVSKINTTTGEASGGIFLKDLIPVVQGSCDENDPPMVVVIESFQVASTQNPKGKYVCWVPKDQILHSAENPYEEIPLVDFHWSPVTISFWTKGYITPLIAPQRFINKRMSQLGEQSNASIYSQLLLAPGMSMKDIPSDYPGGVPNAINPDTGAPLVQRLAGPDIPHWFLQSIELAVKMFNDAAGGADLMEDNKFPGQLRGPQAVPMLQEILDTQWGPLFAHLGERLARVKQMRLNRVKQFYPPLRTMHYTDKTQKDEVLTFHTEKVLRGGTNFSITVERGALLPELRALRESRVRERLQGPLAILYMDERTGRLDKSKIAADLQFGDTGREARESKYRKLGQEIIKLMWQGQNVPDVQPFYDHTAMLDELEDAMATTEFLKASQTIQALFAKRWQQHSFFLQQEAMAQQQAMQGQMIHSAVAQATQQAAAMAAADAVNETQNQITAQRQQPTEQYVSAAQAKAQGQRPGREKAPQPGKKSKKVTVEESEG